jgi:hypothetical protein
MAALVTVDDLAVGFTAAWQVMTVASFSSSASSAGKGEPAERRQVSYLWGWPGCSSFRRLLCQATVRRAAGRDHRQAGLTGGLPLLGFLAWLLAGSA